MPTETKPKASDQCTPEEVFDAMERWGGGFVSHLGAAWRRAGRLNAARLMSVLGEEYYEEYAKRVILHREDERRRHAGQ